MGCVFRGGEGSAAILSWAGWEQLPGSVQVWDPAARGKVRGGGVSTPKPCIVQWINILVKFDVAEEELEPSKVLKWLWPQAPIASVKPWRIK